MQALQVHGLNDNDASSKVQLVEQSKQKLFALMQQRDLSADELFHAVDSNQNNLIEHKELVQFLSALFNDPNQQKTISLKDLELIFNFEGSALSKKEFV